MNSAPNSLQELCQWYHSQCDGDWEHQHGVRIETLDNPGWWIKIDVPKWKEDTQVLKIGADGSCPWIEIHLNEGVLNGVCGPNQLPELLDALLAYLKNRNVLK